MLRAIDQWKQTHQRELTNQEPDQEIEVDGHKYTTSHLRRFMKRQSTRQWSDEGSERAQSDKELVNNILTVKSGRNSEASTPSSIRASVPGSPRASFLVRSAHVSETRGLSDSTIAQSLSSIGASSVVDSSNSRNDYQGDEYPSRSDNPTSSTAPVLSPTRKRKHSPEPDASDHERHNLRGNDDVSPQESRLLACPYFKHDPVRYGNNAQDRRYRNCGAASFASIAYLK